MAALFPELWTITSGLNLGSHWDDLRLKSDSLHTIRRVDQNLFPCRSRPGKRNLVDAMVADEQRTDFSVAI